MSQKNLHRVSAAQQQQNNNQQQQQKQQQQQPQYFASSWGLASKGQLGYAYHSIKSINAGQVSPLERNENFLEMACGENHTMLLTESLEVASCGSNTYGQLGIGQFQEKPVNSNMFKVLQPAQQQTQLQFDQVACGSEHSMALSTEGDLYSWGLNFKGQLGVGDFENRAQPLLVDSFTTGGNLMVGQAGNGSNQQTKKYLVQMLKRSKSKENGAGGNIVGMGSQTQRINPSAVMNSQDATANGEANGQNNRQLAGIQNGQRNANLVPQGSSASKSIFNASFKELKPSKSVDLTASMAGQADGGQSLGSPGYLGSNEEAENYEQLYLFKPSEKVVQVACGSIHSMILTSINRLFSCGNGSTFALGHSSRESCSTFRLIEFFNGPVNTNQLQTQQSTMSQPEQSSAQASTQPPGLQNVQFKTIACGLSHSGCVTAEGQVYIWGLTGEVSGKANQDKLLDKCLYKRPHPVSFRHCLERDPGSSNAAQQQRRKSGNNDASPETTASSALIEDIKMGEYFTIAMSTRGYVYTFGMNDKGQLGINSDVPYSFEPVAVSSSKSTLSKAVQRIDCGLKHCIVLTKDYQLYSWGSNQLYQLGRKLAQQQPASRNFSPQPGQITAFDGAKPFKVTCGSYHNVCLSYRLPKIEEPEANEENNGQLQVLGQRSQNNGAAAGSKAAGSCVLQDESCPNMEQVQKLKGEIKRLRQELILKGPSKQRQMNEYDSEDDSGGDGVFDEEERAALRLLSPNHQKKFEQMEQAGANPQYLKRKLKQALIQQQQTGVNAYVSNEARAFIQNNEIPFGDLSYERKLSEGGYGIVYRGRWKHTVVAIKEIKREIIEQDKLEEFKNECAVMEVIRHPNIVLYLGACTRQPNLCIVLEYCARGSLWSLLHDMQIKMTWDYRKKFALDIAKGVYYLHTSKQPILHRDLKSLNILLDHALTAKLADFGWTRIKAKVMTSKIGTYQWMAPEVIKGFKYTEKADVFSFAVIMWELATRKPPYYGIDGQVVSQRVVKEGLRPKISERDAPGPFLDLMKRCWDDDPDRRPYFGEIMRELEAMNFKNIG